MNKPNAVAAFAALAAEFEAGRLPASKASMIRLVALAGLALVQAGQISGRISAEAQKAIGAVLKEVRRAEADLAAGRPDEALAVLQRLLASAQANIVVSKPAGSA